jgi:hypothetical protein
METVKSIRIVNVSESLIDINISWNAGQMQEYFSLMHSMMLYFDCGEFGIPYSSLVTVDIKNGSETARHEFTYSSRSIEKGQVVVQPTRALAAMAEREEDDYGQIHSIRQLSINNDLHERVTIQFSWDSGKKEYTLYNTAMINMDCEEIPTNSRVDVEIVHPHKKAHLWFMRTPASEAAQLTLVDRGSGMLVYTQYRMA